MWLNELVAAHLPGELKFTPLKHSGMIVVSHEQWSTGQRLVEHVQTCFRSTVVSRVVSGGRPWCYLLRFWATRTMCTPCSPKYRGDFPAIPPSSFVDPASYSRLVWTITASFTPLSKYASLQTRSILIVSEPKRSASKTNVTSNAT